MPALCLQVILEGLGLGALLVLVCAVGIRKGAVGMVHLYSLAVQQRCVKLGLTSPERIRRNSLLFKAVCVPGYIAYVLGCVYAVNGAKGFVQGFWQLLVILSVRKWVKMFQVAYLTGTVCWGYVHAMFMNVALIFKFTFVQYGDMRAAAEIANKVFYCNAAPLLAAYILCDVLLSVVMLVMIWKRMLPLKTTAQRILASFCNPIVFTGIVGNLFTLLPWPLDQIDHGTESAGHLLVLVLGLVLLREMTKSGELKEVEIKR